MDELKSNSIQFCSNRILSSEIVEISEELISTASNARDAADVINDVYVAVGKDDLHVLKWALDHVLPPGAQLFLVHVFPPISYIYTPVGRLSRSQLSQDQVRYYANEEHNRRRTLLQKYIRLCNDSKVSVETMLIESNTTAKAILDLIPVLNITKLVMGTTRSPPRSRLLGKKLGKTEFVKKNAPEYCEITVVDDGSNIVDVEQPEDTNKNNSQRKLLKCACFPGRNNVKDNI